MSAASAVCTIPVTGMTCAACSGRVQRSLERTPGVSSASVNLMTGDATVAFDPGAIRPERLVEVIRDTGYGADLPAQARDPEDAFETQERERVLEMKTLQWKLGVALVPAVIRTERPAAGLAWPLRCRWSAGADATSTSARGPR